MRLDWGFLVRALEGRDDGLYGVDPSSGTIRFFDRRELEADDPDELWDEARFVMVDPVGSEVVGEWLEEFAETVGGPLGEALADAARRADPRAAARTLLAEEPELKAAWRRHRRRCVQSLAEGWASEHGIRPENDPPWRP